MGTMLCCRATPRARGQALYSIRSDQGHIRRPSLRPPRQLCAPLPVHGHALVRTMADQLNVSMLKHF